MKQIVITPSLLDRTDECANIYLKEISKYQPLSQAQEAELNQRVKAGDRMAYEEFVNRNTRFVVSVAKAYQNKGLALCDLISAGNIGLCTAAADFDASKGFRFTSFAVYRIQQAIESELQNHAKQIHIPRRVQKLQCRIASAKAIYEAQHSESPTIEWLADYLKLDEKEVAQAVASMFNYDAMSATYRNDEEDGDTREASYASEAWADDELIAESDRAELYQQMRRLLTDREVRILGRLFGMDGYEETTLEEIAHLEHLSRERVRQIRDVAFRKLRGAA